MIELGEKDLNTAQLRENKKWAEHPVFFKCFLAISSDKNRATLIFDVWLKNCLTPQRNYRSTPLPCSGNPVGPFFVVPGLRRRPPCWPRRPTAPWRWTPCTCCARPGPPSRRTSGSRAWKERKVKERRGAQSLTFHGKYPF